MPDALELLKTRRSIKPVELAGPAVDAVALADRPTLRSTREVEIRGEHVARVALLAPVAFAAATSTTEVSVP